MWIKLLVKQARQRNAQLFCEEGRAEKHVEIFCEHAHNLFTANTYVGTLTSSRIGCPGALLALLVAPSCPRYPSHLNEDSIKGIGNEMMVFWWKSIKITRPTSSFKVQSLPQLTAVSAKRSLIWFPQSWISTGHSVVTDTSFITRFWLFISKKYRRFNIRAHIQAFSRACKILRRREILLDIDRGAYGLLFARCSENPTLDSMVLTGYRNSERRFGLHAYKFNSHQHMHHKLAMQQLPRALNESELSNQRSMKGTPFRK